MAHENFSTVLTENDIKSRSSDPNDPVSELSKKHPDGKTIPADWKRLIGTRELFINGIEVVFDHDEDTIEAMMAGEGEQFTAWLQNKFLSINPNTPHHLIKFLIENGNQSSFGFNGLNYALKFAPQFLNVMSVVVGNNSAVNVILGDSEIYLTTDMKFDGFSSMEASEILCNAIKLPPEKTMAVITTFKIQTKKNGGEQNQDTADFVCTSHKDNLLLHLYEIRKAEAVNLATNKNLSKKNVPLAKQKCLLRIIHLLQESRPYVDPAFEAAIRNLCESTKDMDSTTKGHIQFIEDYLKLNTENVWADENISAVFNAPKNQRQHELLKVDRKKQNKRNAIANLWRVSKNSTSKITLAALKSDENISPTLRKYISRLMSAQGILSLTNDIDFQQAFGDKNLRLRLKALGFEHSDYAIFVTSSEKNKVELRLIVYVKNELGETLSEKSLRIELEDKNGEDETALENITYRILDRNYSENMLPKLAAKSDVTVLQEKLNTLSKTRDDVNKETKDSLYDLAQQVGVAANPEVKSFMEAVVNKPQEFDCARVNQLINTTKIQNDSFRDLTTVESFAKTLSLDPAREPDPRALGNVVINYSNCSIKKEEASQKDTLDSLKALGVSENICKHIEKNLNGNGLSTHLFYDGTKIPNMDKDYFNRLRSSPVNTLTYTFSILDPDHIKLHLQKEVKTAQPHINSYFVEYTVEISAAENAAIAVSAKSFYFQPPISLMAEKVLRGAEITTEDKAYIQQILLPYYEIKQNHLVQPYLARTDKDADENILTLIATHGFSVSSRLEAVHQLAENGNRDILSRLFPGIPENDPGAIELHLLMTGKISLETCLKSQIGGNPWKAHVVRLTLEERGKFSEQLIDLASRKPDIYGVSTFLQRTAQTTPRFWWSKSRKIQQRTASEIQTVREILSAPEQQMKHIKSLSFDAKKMLVKQVAPQKFDDEFIRSILSDLTAPQKLAFRDYFTDKSTFNDNVYYSEDVAAFSQNRANDLLDNTTAEDLKTLALIDTSGQMLSKLIEGAQKEIKPLRFWEDWFPRIFKQTNKENLLIQKQKDAIQTINFADLMDIDISPLKESTFYQERFNAISGPLSELKDFLRSNLDIFPEFSDIREDGVTRSEARQDIDLFLTSDLGNQKSNRYMKKILENPEFFRLLEPKKEAISAQISFLSEHCGIKPLTDAKKPDDSKLRRSSSYATALDILAPSPKISPRDNEIEGLINATPTKIPSAAVTYDTDESNSSEASPMGTPRTATHRGHVQTTPGMIPVTLTSSSDGKEEEEEEEELKTSKKNKQGTSTAKRGLVFDGDALPSSVGLVK